MSSRFRNHSFFILSLLVIMVILISACTGATTGGTSKATTTPPPSGNSGNPPGLGLPITGLTNKQKPIETPTTGVTSDGVPVFSHVIIIMLENHGYNQVISNGDMPNFNRFAKEFTLLTQDYAVAHPSLPNYLALISGSTHGITSDCGNCFIDATTLANLVDAKQMTWKTYQEGIPSPCYVGFKPNYSLNHDPFVYFNSIRNNQALCDSHVVPFTQMQADINTGSFPNFAFISPNLCNAAHNCNLATADKWIGETIGTLMKSPVYDQNTLIVVTFDEGDGNASCCGLPREAGGRVATLLISPLVKSGFEDSTPYSHYSILKTISDSWGLEQLGHAADQATSLIVAPWKTSQ